MEIKVLESLIVFILQYVATIYLLLSEFRAILFCFIFSGLKLNFNLVTGMALPGGLEAVAPVILLRPYFGA